ncbi:hypothetical protein WICMUC_001821 [Wickerhamomyces mucosus]|uniref:Palmitoyltransferase n=1 Tax=Wickerhamomyces mucosus TaxID=1378264 RepID=A0A9P8TG06_9ASCO|nr:hypothetical protein WICMUC_001821 [Wickerhamomyces mucosus]
MDSVMEDKPPAKEGTDITLKAQDQTEEGTSGQLDDPGSPSSVQGVIDQESDILIEKYSNACQVGDIVTIKTLLESGAVELGQDADTNNVTGLHWACINNRLTVVKYLVEQGAEIDREGGELNATPLHWACRYGLVYIVDYLLKQGADPTKVDAQGFNALHLAIHSSNIMLVIYILNFAKQIPVDSPDPNERTSLHWAAYQGDSLSVDTLLKLNANVHKSDNQGFTPLHWSLIRGQKECVKRLIEQGSEIYRKTNDNKDCFEIAKDMNNTNVLKQALYEAGFQPNGQPLNKALDANWGKLITFFFPYFLIGIILYISSTCNIIVTILSLFVLYFGSVTLFQKLIFPTYILSKSPMMKSPLLSGVFSGTAFWVILVWLSTVLPFTFDRKPLINFLFSIFASSTIYCFQKAMFRDPGIIEPPTSNDQIKENIQDLLKTGKYDAKHFCIHTFIRKPLRSKFSHFYQKCVSKYDHACPWVYNDIGLRNHKIFMFFILSLEITILLYLGLVSEYFDVLEDDHVDCSFLNDEFCAGFTYSKFTFLLTFWTFFQFIWLSFLVFSQLVQISKGVTTLELSIFVKNIDHGVNPYYSSAPLELLESETPAISSTSNSNKNCFSTICLLTGLDQFLVALKQLLGMENNGRPELSTDYGLKQNCIDFWFASGDDGLKFRNLLKLPVHDEASLNGQKVNYYKLYALPEKASNYSDSIV